MAKWRVVRWISRHTLSDGRHKKGLRVTYIEEKMKEKCLIWFEHMQQRGIGVPERKLEGWNGEFIKTLRKIKNDLERGSAKGF